MSPLTAILLLALAAPPDATADVAGWHATEFSAKGIVSEPSPAVRKLGAVPPESSLVAPSDKTGQPAESHYPGATAVAEWKFEPTRDEEIYGLPPGWTKRHGPGFPRYVQVQVDDDSPPPGGRSLRVVLNGGAASAFGATIAIEPGVDYLLEGFIKTSQLKHDTACISLTFLDSARMKLTSPTSAPISGTSGWQKVCIGPLAPPAGALSLIVGINVAPRGEAEDLHGAAAFGALWLGAAPRFALTARLVDGRGQRSSSGNKLDGSIQSSIRGAGDTSFSLFSCGKPVEVGCLLTGFTVPKYEVRLALEDYAGRKLAQHAETFATSPAQPTSKTTNGKSGGAKALIESRGGNSRTTWQIPSQPVGYYRINAQIVPLSDGEGSLPASAPHATLGLAIIDPESPQANSEFGWSLDPHDAALGLVSLSDLLAQSGIRSVKFPFACSFDAKPATALQPTGKPTAPPPATIQEPDRIEPLISFNDRLASGGVRLVGELLPPPASTAPGQAKRELLAVEAFAGDAKTWFPSIEPVLARMATEIRFWQIGDDRDPSWTGCSDLTKVVTQAKSALDQIGQDLNVGVAWNFKAPLPVAGKIAGIPPRRNAPSADREYPGSRTKTPWSFLALPCDDAISDVELAARLDGTKSADVQRWLTIDALPQTGHSGDERIARLVNRLIAAKLHGAEGIFFAHPFDAERGLVGRDGSPSELFLPWRTTALTLGGATYAGDIDLAGGSRIHCFGGNGKYFGVLMGAAPRRETVYLGNDLHCRDVWGRVTDCRPTVGESSPTESAVQHVGWTSGSVTRKPDGSEGPSYAPAAQSLVDIQRLPIFLTGLDGRVTEWQLNVAFAPQSLPSVPFSEAAVALEMKNTLPRVVTGRVRITPPQNWHVVPKIAEFRLEPGAAWKLPLKVVLPNDVLAGRQMVALEFEIQSDRFDHFTMYRPIEVALGDVAMDAHAALTEQGDLEVRQSLSNHGKRTVGFCCNLIVPDRRLQSTRIVLQPDATSDFAYRLPDGRELLDKPLWLRAEEINGPRILNYRLEAPAGQ